jgi:hypothetical protein
MVPICECGEGYVLVENKAHDSSNPNSLKYVCADQSKVLFSCTDEEADCIMGQGSKLNGGCIRGYYWSEEGCQSTNPEYIYCM